MDALNSVLNVLRLKPQTLYRSELTAPWGLEFSVTNAASFHLVETGQAWLLMGDSSAPLLLSTGDLVVISNTAHYQIVEQVGSATMPASELFNHRREANNGKVNVQVGDIVSGPITVLVCGEFRPEQDVIYPLFSLLPSLIYVQNKDGKAMEWLTNPLELIASETQTRYPGFETVISRLMDILFIMVMRYWIAHHLNEEGGWLQALYHPQIGQILGLMHRQPEKLWTVDTLAHSVYLSRSTFTSQFTTMVGEPPMKYLTRWRIQLATTLLTDNNMAVEHVAAHVGYTSSYAFSKAFKRMVGISPSEYRQNHLQAEQKQPIQVLS